MKSILLVIAGVAILLAPRIQTTGDPGAGYTWSLGDLAADSARLDVDWNHSEWADAYDTEAELNALGWSTIDVDPTVSPASPTGSCAADSSGVLDEDEQVLTDYFAANCTAPSGSTPGVCNNVFKLQASCQYDHVAINGDIGDTATISLPYSNYAIIGQTGSVISINNGAEVTTSAIEVGFAFGNSSSWGNAGGSDGTTYTASASTLTKGTADLTLSETDCSAFDSDDLVKITGTDADGAALTYNTRTTAVVDNGSTCTVTVADPLPVTFGSITTMTERGQNRTRKTFFMDFTLQYPNVPVGVCTVEPAGSTSRSCAIGFRWHGAEEWLLDNVTIGPYGNSAFDTRDIYRMVIRNSWIGPSQYSMRRSNNASALHGTPPEGSFISFYNNVLDSGAIRLTLTTPMVTFGYYGFNYQTDQTGINGDTGNYCTGLSGIGGGFPWIGLGPERSFLVNHDTGFEGVGHFLGEANDLKCQFFDEGLNDNRRYGTMYRNRFVGQSPLFVTNSGAVQSYPNYFANRAGTYTFGGSLNNATGRWNIATTTMATPSGSGSITWPASGDAGENVVDANSHDDSATVNLPPSLAFRQDSPPDWWCQESGTWAALGDDDTAFSFGYADGYLGTTHKLPAQIRYEGGSCTPP